MKIRVALLLALMVVLALHGYPVIASLTVLIGIENSYLAIPFRAIIAALSLAIIFKKKWLVKNGFFVFCLLLFWVILFLHFLGIILYNGGFKGFHDAEFYLWATLVCFLPMLATVQISSLSQPDLDMSFKVMLATSFITCVLVSVNFVLVGGESLMINNRLQLPSLNPISVSYSGSILILLSIFFFSQRKWSFFYRMAWVAVSLALGIVILLLSNSRGPVLSLCLVLLVWFFYSNKKMRKQNIFLISVALLAPTISYYFSNFLRFDFEVSRFAVIYSDPSYRIRLQLLVSAYEAFAASPIVGSIQLVSEMEFHPHNILLDSLMRVGIIGTLFFLVPIVFGIYESIRMVKRKSANAWIGLLYLHAFLMACISGSIHESYDFWVLLAAIISLSTTQRNFQNAVPPEVRGAGLSNNAA
jgi:O-antigen ligase